MFSSKQRASSSSALPLNETKSLKRPSRCKRTSTGDLWTTYPNVRMGDKRGSLKLSDQNLSFQADDGSRKLTLGWDQLSKHVISKEQTLLKIVSKKNHSRILELPSRQSLLQLKQEITQRSISRRQSAPLLGNRPTHQLRKTQSHAVRKAVPNVLESRSASMSDILNTPHNKRRSSKRRKSKHHSIRARPELRKTQSQAAVRLSSSKPNTKDVMERFSSSMSALDALKKKLHNKPKPDYNWKKHLSQSASELAFDAAEKRTTVVPQLSEGTSRPTHQLRKTQSHAVRKAVPNVLESRSASMSDILETPHNKRRSSKRRKSKPNSNRKNGRPELRKTQSQAAVHLSSIKPNNKDAMEHLSSSMSALDVFGPNNKPKPYYNWKKHLSARNLTVTSVGDPNHPKTTVAAAAEEEGGPTDVGSSPLITSPTSAATEAEEEGPTEVGSSPVITISPAANANAKTTTTEKGTSNQTVTMADLMFSLGQTKGKKKTEAKVKATKDSFKDIKITDTVEGDIRKDQHNRERKYKRTVSNQKEENTNFDMARSLFGGGGGGEEVDEEEAPASSANATTEEHTTSAAKANTEEHIRVNLILNSASKMEFPAEAQTESEPMDDGSNKRASLDNDSLYPRDSFSPSARDSTMSFGMSENEIERQILQAMGKSLSEVAASVEPTTEEDAKAARKARMSVRMSTRVQAMNTLQQASRRASSTANTNRRTSTTTRMSVSLGLRSSTRMSVTRRGSGGFVLLKDLEERDEFQKVQAGAFLRELYQLAEAEAQDHLREDLLLNKGEPDNDNETTFNMSSLFTVTISLQDLDLANLTKEEALTTIESLHQNKGKVDGDSVIALVQAAVEVLSQEENVVDLRELHPNLNQVIAVGDLHGSLECIMSVLKLADIDNLADDSVLVFDGDFVDRGYNSLEVIVTLLLLKLSHPKNVFLLRGNHEDSMTASSYGFRDEVDEKYGYEKGDEIWWEFGLLFAAFPIIARSNTAAIMHGGIPVEEFDLDDLNEMIPKETRCEMKTISDPYDDDERMLQGILWSDPCEEEGIDFSDRGAGFTFGPDISADFLDRHDLKYLIRAHEVVETGHCHHDVGEGREVITIFSTANYPAMEGTNQGAVLFLNDQTGEYETKEFIHKENNESSETEVFNNFLGGFVDGHKSHLTQAFREQQNDEGQVTTEQWADVIAELLDVPDIDLMLLSIQPDLAPTTEEDGDLIDWRAFLNQYTTVPVLATDDLTALSENKDKCLDIFQLMDTSMDGAISKEEFTTGVKLLNQQITDDNQKIRDAERLFDAFDVDHDGELTVEEFSKALQESTELKGVAGALKDDQVEHLKRNQDTIAAAFKYLDTDKNGGIDRQEFEKGFEALNERMSERNKFGKHEDWFNMFELNDSEQIDFNAFKQVFCAI